ncbi:MAG: hypothetical protein M3296_09535 [Actinomycetota bacterium]|nr:hypothetical protein [Actinomycetota bacterium]
MLEVNQPHAHTRRRRGKSAPLDAEMAARLALAGKATTIPKQTTGESIRLLRVTRASAVKAHSAAMVQLSQLIITAPQQLREQFAGRRSIGGKAALCRRLRPVLSDLDQPAQAAKLALRSLARRIHELDSEIARARRRAHAARRARRTAHDSAAGISTGHAGQLLITAGQNIDRLRGDAALASLRRQPDPRLVRTHHPSPAQLRRRPRRQPHPADDRRLSPALLRAHPGLRRPPHPQRQDQTRDHPLPEALHRTRDLPRPHRRPHRPHALGPPRPRHAIAITCGAAFIGRSRRQLGT